MASNANSHMRMLMEAAAADQAKLHAHHAAHRDADEAFGRVHNGRPIDKAAMHQHMSAHIMGKPASHTGNSTYAPEDVQGGDPSSDDSSGL